MLVTSVIATVIITTLAVGSVSAQLVTPSPMTLEERVQRVDAVMRLRVDDASVVRAVDITSVLERNNPGIVFQSRAIVPVTEYRTQIIEIIKGFAYGVVGAPLRIGIPGGRATFQGRQVVVTDLERPPSLIPGATYLVFLNYSEETDLLMFAGADIYRVDGPTIEGNPLASQTDYGKRIVGQPSEDVLSNIRSMVTRTP